MNDKLNLDMEFAKKISNQNADKQWKLSEQRRKHEEEQRMYNRIFWVLLAIVFGLLTILKIVS